MSMDYLDPAERTRLQELRLAEPFVDETLRQLDRILASQQFDRVQEKARAFLGVVVTQTLLGHADLIKEMTVALSAFHESTDFNPAENSKIRMAAADLRQRVAEYYAAAGQDDPIEIVIPAGTYVPEFRDRRISIDVCPFDNWHPKGEQGHLCSLLGEEIVHCLNQDRRVRARRVDMLDAGDATRYRLRGSVEHGTDILRVNVSLADLSTGHVVHWRSFEERRVNVLQLAQDVAHSLLRALTTKTEGEDSVHATARKRLR